jgi:hypothetical protein
MALAGVSRIADVKGAALGITRTLLVSQGYSLRHIF